jgi:hypothetical protein
MMEGRSTGVTESGIILFRWQAVQRRLASRK